MEEALSAAAEVEGHLADKEGRFLAMVAASPTAEGAVLEIGSFKGKSTVLLAKAASLAGRPGVVAVDPLTSPAATDPDLGGKPTDPEEFRAGLRRAGVEESVEFNQMLSQELAVSWDRPLRFLWIDGDHTYAGAKSDFDLFSPHLEDGAIIALHDVLHAVDGPIRVFMEDILLSDRFGPAGLCGSIGWAQALEDRSAAAMSRLIPYAVFRTPKTRMPRLDYIRWRIRRGRVPHGPPVPSRWRRQVGLAD
jgi:predicted O-methyltransferase YrrM